MGQAQEQALQLAERQALGRLMGTGMSTPKQLDYTKTAGFSVGIHELHMRWPRPWETGSTVIRCVSSILLPVLCTEMTTERQRRTLKTSTLRIGV